MPKITKAGGATNAAERSSLAEPQESEPEASPALERPAKSDTREAWNEYAESVGVEDAATLSNKAAVIKAVDKAEG